MESYTTEARLCDDEGMVEDEFLDLYRRLATLDPERKVWDKPFVCTGSAHLGGEHIRCTSTYHERAAKDVVPAGMERVPVFGVPGLFINQPYDRRRLVVITGV